MSIKDKKHILGGPSIIDVKADQSIKKLAKTQQENAHRAANPKPLKKSNFK